MTAPAQSTAPDIRSDAVRPIIDDELSALADCYRLPILLCDLEGKSRKEAATQLGWPEGSRAS